MQLNITEVQNLGGKKKKTNKNVLRVGKIFADWCGHCQSLQPEWEKMKRDMKLGLGRNLNNMHIEFIEIGDTQKNKAKGLTVDGMIDKFNKTALGNSSEKLKNDGYPTLFKMYNGKLEYYTGARDAKSMYSWYLQEHNNNKPRVYGGGGGGGKTKKRGLMGTMSNFFSMKPFVSRKRTTRRKR